MPAIAQACGSPSEQWYRDASDIIFEGSALCKPEEEFCRINVSRTLKNPQALAVEGKRIEIDYFNWYEDYYEKNPDTIILACGVPVFDPEETRFRARFYANYDQETRELRVRRYVVLDQKTSEIEND
jgi:hypothetical protein